MEYVENSLHCTRIKSDLASDLSGDRHDYQTSDWESKTQLSPRQKAEAKVEIELQKLERAYQAGILEQAEFSAKKALEVTVERYEIDFAIEEQMAKLETAFIEGILNEREYEAKVANIAERIEEQIVRQRLEAKQKEYLAKLKQSVEGGLLSQEEYEAKVANLNSCP